MPHTKTKVGHWETGKAVVGQMMRKSEELLKYALEIWYFQSGIVVQKLGCDIPERNDHGRFVLL